MALTVVDAGVMIGFLDRDDPHHVAAGSILRETVGRGDRLVLPASALAELLVAPSRRGGTAIDTVLGLLRRVPIEVIPLDQPIAIAAAALRARHRALKLPDALVIATAAANAAARLITTDRGWPTARNLALTTTMVTI